MSEADGSFDAFYRESRERLVGQLAGLTGDRAEAHDHVQEAFVRAWARWKTVGTLDDPEGWVRHVARNLAVSRWRRARRLVFTRADIEIEWDGEQVAIIEALRTLPAREREAVVLHHLVGLPVDAIARELGAPSGTVKSWLSRGRAKLAEQLGDHDE